ncbi:MAG: hypothetical protein QM756_27780 [Polyangiaceae bacterium]
MTRRAAQVAAALCLTLVSARALAEEQRVVVLMSRGLPETPWPEGTQAVIAELAASHYQVIVESTAANELGALLADLRDAANQDDNAGAVAVVRARGAGIAYVWTRRDANVVQVHSDNTEGAVSEGALALRVLELIRARSLPLPEPKEAPRLAEKPKRQESPAPESPPPSEPAKARKALLWLGVGPTFAAGAPGPLVEAALGARFAVWQPLSLEAGAAVSLAPLGVDTSAGSVELSSRRLSTHLMLEPWRSALFRVGLGAGGGALWLSESARAASGFTAHADDTYLGFLSMRASGALQSGDLSFVLALEPGLLLRRASIRAGGAEVASFGSGWLNLSAGIGYSP